MSSNPSAVCVFVKCTIQNYLRDVTQLSVSSTSTIADIRRNAIDLFDLDNLSPNELAVLYRDERLAMPTLVTELTANSLDYPLCISLGEIPSIDRVQTTFPPNPHRDEFSIVADCKLSWGAYGVVADVVRTATATAAVTAINPSNASNAAKKDKVFVAKFSGYTNNEPDIEWILGEIEILARLRGVKGAVQLEATMNDTQQGLLTTYHSSKLAKNSNLRMQVFPVIIMEKLSDLPFREQICLTKEFKECDAQKIFRSFCEALMNIHDKNIINCDLKLENLLFTSRDSLREVKIIDFGMSTNLHESRKEYLHAPGSMFGTLHCLCPTTVLAARGTSEHSNSGKGVGPVPGPGAGPGPGPGPGAESGPGTGPGLGAGPGSGPGLGGECPTATAPAALSPRSDYSQDRDRSIGQGKYSKRTDWYQAGCILFFLLTGRELFEAENRNRKTFDDVLTAITDGDIVKHYIDSIVNDPNCDTAHVSNEAIDLLRYLLTDPLCPAERVLSHAWFQMNSNQLKQINYITRFGKSVVFVGRFLRAIGNMNSNWSRMSHNSSLNIMHTNSSNINNNSNINSNSNSNVSHALRISLADAINLICKLKECFRNKLQHQLQQQLQQSDAIDSRETVPMQVAGCSELREESQMLDCYVTNAANNSFFASGRFFSSTAMEVVNGQQQQQQQQLPQQLPQQQQQQQDLSQLIQQQQQQQQPQLRRAFMCTPLPINQILSIYAEANVSRLVNLDNFFAQAFNIGNETHLTYVQCFHTILSVIASRVDVMDPNANAKAIANSSNVAIASLLFDIIHVIEQDEYITRDDIATFLKDFVGIEEDWFPHIFFKEQYNRGQFVELFAKLLSKVRK